ncbi:MAG TPA: SRPBCC domain-containing protein [Phenylobacterium sp.]|nr:SRPBCC domain-containing protein [Phenylobacterium sp.]
MPFKSEPDLLAGPFGKRVSMGPKTMSLQTEGKPPPPKGPTGFRIEDRIGVHAPADVIWEVIYDLPKWAEWNPTYPHAEGEVRIGNVLTLDLALPGQDRQQIKAKVLDWVPNEQLHWELRMMGGLIKTLRYIEITPLVDEGCIVDNGELFGGLMGPSLGRRMRGPVRRGFLAMNEALKARAEAEWASRKA